MIFTTLNQFVTGNATVEQTIAHIQKLSQDLTKMPESQVHELATSILQEAKTNPSAQGNFAEAFSACSVNPPLRSQLANQVYHYFGLLNDKVDLKPLHTLIKQPDYVTTLPEPLLVQIVKQTDLLELARLSQTCRRLHATVAEPLGKVKSIWDALSAHIRDLEEVPPDVLAKLKAPPTRDALLFLERWLKARDCLTIWKILVTLSGDSVRLNGSSGEGMIKQTEGFAGWLAIFIRWLPKELDLRDLKLTFLPPEIGKLNHLVSLHLDRNKLTELPPELSQLGNLEKLSLEQNQLRSLPAWIGSLSRLQSLEISRNCLTCLPPTMGKLTCLENLNLSFNALQGLPTSIGRLQALKSLQLEHNQLSSLPQEMGQLPKLQNLRLDHNCFRSLPPEIGHLLSLQSLSLSHNTIDSLPAEMELLTSLSTLDLKSNQVEIVPSLVWRLPSLRELNLCDNGISSLDPCTELAHSLQTLQLSSNQLASFPNFLCQLTALRTLSLDQNQLSELSDEIETLSQLTRLDLQGNPLVSLPAQIHNLSSLLYLNLPDMPQDTLSIFLTSLSLRILKVGDRWLIAPPSKPSDDPDCRIA